MHPLPLQQLDTLSCDTLSCAGGWLGDTCWVSAPEGLQHFLSQLSLTQQLRSNSNNNTPEFWRGALHFAIEWPQATLFGRNVMDPFYREGD